MVGGALANLYPGYFAMVMATGIVSVAMKGLGFAALSQALLWLAGSAYVLLVALFAARGLLFARRVAHDLLDPKTMFTFFTFVAGSAVLGIRLWSAGLVAAAGVLAMVAAVSWLALSYSTFGALFVTSEKPLVEVVNGGWLIAVVATQSVAILACTLWNGTNMALIFGAYALWAVGVLLYVVLVTIIVLRLGFYRIIPGDLSPPYWINMGASAISMVAAATLLSRADHVPFLRPVAPTLYAAMLALWAWGTWWIPLLILIGIWKYGLRQLPLTYEPGLWSIVFPLGMYTVATLRLAVVAGLPFLAGVAAVFVWVAFAAWTLTAGAGLYTLLRSTRAAFRPQPRIP